MRLVICLVLALAACQPARPSAGVAPSSTSATGAATASAVPSAGQPPAPCELDTECRCTPPQRPLCLRPWVNGEHVPGECRCE